MEGWLEKKCLKEVKWKKRWVVLQEEKLYYFKEQTEKFEGKKNNTTY